MDHFKTCLSSFHLKKNFIEFIGVILVNKIIQVSGVHFYNTPSVYCIVCSPSKVKPPSITTDLPLPPDLPPLTPPFPLVISILLSVSMIFFLIPSPFSLSPLTPSPLTAVSLFSLSMSLFLFCLLVYSVHQSPHMREIIWYLSFSDLLVSLSIILSWFIHAVIKGRTSFGFIAEQYSPI